MERGDIWHVDLEPTRGREQAKPRFVLVVTSRLINRLGTPIVAPITRGGNFARVRGLTVGVEGPGLRTSGVILCHQLRAMDLLARQARFVERAPDHIMMEVLAKVAAILE